MGEVGIGKVGCVGVFDEVASCQLDYPLQQYVVVEAAHMPSTWKKYMKLTTATQGISVSPQHCFFLIAIQNLID